MRSPDVRRAATSFRKGHTYGTIPIDIERRGPVDVLPDREADTVGRWLADHPGVDVNCPDRSTTYADGAGTGAPEAAHCADTAGTSSSRPWKRPSSATAPCSPSHPTTRRRSRPTWLTLRCPPPRAPPFSAGLDGSASAPANGTPTCTRCINRASSEAPTHPAVSTLRKIANRVWPFRLPQPPP
ncbi:transposase [Streptomyces formicae]|uniref:Transposase n=1 Tax=Streptomyces formicae TaxID=1616117 RepID=A0ABY3WNY8_9ACTN|nr:transposase [Streptomyces formicae]